MVGVRIQPGLGAAGWRRTAVPREGAALLFDLQEVVVAPVWYMASAVERQLATECRSNLPGTHFATAHQKSHIT